MTHPFLEQIKTLTGRQLYSVMSQAKAKGQDVVFNACYERAEELSRKVGDWDMAKRVFEGLEFPDIAEQSRVTHLELSRIEGFQVYAHQYLSAKYESKFEFLVMVNGQGNCAVIKWFTKDGKPYSELDEQASRIFQLPRGGGREHRPQAAPFWQVETIGLANRKVGWGECVCSSQLALS